MTLLLSTMSTYILLPFLLYLTRVILPSWNDGVNNYYYNRIVVNESTIHTYSIIIFIHRTCTINLSLYYVGISR
jgi:hypothetical protein